MAKIKKIKTLTQYLSEILSLDTKHNVFFRGHSNFKYELKPGIYRKDNIGKSLIEFEDKIYREIIASAPQEFVGKNTLETLALMQHYDAPTRVLDLTENAMVALYFACFGNEKHDGEVIVFDIPDANVCHYDSDRVTILANLAKCGTDFYFQPNRNGFYEDYIKTLEKLRVEMELVEELEKPNYNLLKFLADNSEKIISNYNDDIYGESFELIYERFLIEFDSSALTNTDKKVFRNGFIEVLINHFKDKIQEEIVNCNRNYFGKLLHNIREDKSYFDAVINPIDLQSVFAVKPKLNNPRIAKQHGSFLIFGIQPTLFTDYGDYKPMAELNRTWVKRGGESGHRIIVDKKFKPQLLNDLENIGFNQATLFPEVDKVASFVKSKYLKKVK